MRKNVIVCLLLIFSIVTSVKDFAVPMRQTCKAKGKESGYIIMGHYENKENLDELTQVKTASNLATNTKDEIAVYRMTESNAKYIADDDKDIIVEKDRIMHASMNETKKISIDDINLDWYKEMINSDNSSCVSPSKEKIRIAVLDSGVDWGNDIELKKSVTLVPGEEHMNPLFMDGSGHGNSVAGLIAASENEEGITGINPNASIYSIRVLDDNNQAPVSRVVQGIYYAIDQQVNIINMSFGMTSYSEALKKAIDDANEAGILVIAAAGNTGGEVEYPAKFENVVSVGSVDSKANIANTSAKGNDIDIVAPGENVCSTGEFGDVVISSGTSLAAPLVSAAASLIWEKDTSVTKDFIVELLLNCRNQSLSDQYGLLDIDYALKKYDEYKKIHKYNCNISFQNTSPVTTIEETGCVNGSWTKDNHEYLVGSGHANVKKGARYPDINGETQHITPNPGWHGSYHDNYIAAYIYATRMAEQLGKGNSPSKANYVGGLSVSERSNMLEDVKNIDWTAQGMTTNGKKRAFVWGMAMHTAADVFAHSAFVYADGEWCHLAHGDTKEHKNVNDYADNTGKWKERFQAAENVVSNIVYIYDLDNGSGSYGQFEKMNTVAKTFKLKNLSTYIAATSESADLQGTSDFNVSSGKFNYYWKG